MPEARWVGGLAHVLPFESEAFDIVCCNAALHHMRDVPGAMHEMLRVLRPGGWLLTTGNRSAETILGKRPSWKFSTATPMSFSASTSRSPSFGELVEALVFNKERITVRFLTTSLGGQRTGRLAGIAAKWRSTENGGCSYRKRKRLSTASGTLAIRAHVRKPLPLPGKTLGPFVLRAGAYASVLDQYDVALAALAPILPSSFVDSPSPGSDKRSSSSSTGGKSESRKGLSNWRLPAGAVVSDPAGGCEGIAIPCESGGDE